MNKKINDRIFRKGESFTLTIFKAETNSDSSNGKWIAYGDFTINEIRKCLEVFLTDEGIEFRKVDISTSNIHLGTFNAQI